MNPTTPTTSAATFTIKVTGPTPFSATFAAAAWRSLIAQGKLGDNVTVDPTVPRVRSVDGTADVVLAGVDADVIGGRVQALAPVIDCNDTVSVLNVTDTI